jgi:putative membrane protein insertion efficiency factor
VSAVLRAPAYFGIALVWLYRLTIGALVPAGQCKYHPSCSQYAIDALRAKGLVRGSLLAGWRLLRCNPWSRGGYDPAPAPAPAKPPPAFPADSVEPTTVR